MKQLTQQCDDVYVLTGPLYLPQRTPQGYVMHHPMIGALPSCSAQLSPPLLRHTALAQQPASPGSVLRWRAGEPPRLVAVPTHFFKAVLAEKRGEDGAERALVGAWVLPNSPVRTLLLNLGRPSTWLHVAVPSPGRARGRCRSSQTRR